MVNNPKGIPDKDTYELRIDDVIYKLINSPIDSPIKLPYEECLAIASVAKTIFNNECSLIEISAPIHVCGDIHGQFRDLVRLFNLCGSPPQNKYLFLGDYVDRGIYGLECVCLLFSLKIRYPNHIFLLRGNHESENLNRSYGFRDEIRNKYCSSKIWKAILKCFNCLPISALIDNSIFCCHGGLSPLLLDPKVQSLKEVINSIERPCEVALYGLICDLLWSDPAEVVNDDSPPNGWEENERGCSWTFGYDIVESFLEKFDLDLIIRGHQVVEDGYEFFCNRKLLTVFSAPNYCGTFDNAGCIFHLNKNFDTPPGIPPNIEGRFIILRPNINSQDQWKAVGKDSEKTF